MISTKKTWQAQSEMWQAAVKERGDKAYQLFQDTHAIKSCCGNPVMDNGAIETALKHDEGIELKPLYRLIELDIQRYGDNAFLMYEWQIDDCEHPLINDCNYYPVESNYMLKMHTKIGNNVRRKPYANAPYQFPPVCTEE